MKDEKKKKRKSRRSLRIWKQIYRGFQESTQWVISFATFFYFILEATINTRNETYRRRGNWRFGKISRWPLLVRKYSSSKNYYFSELVYTSIDEARFPSTKKSKEVEKESKVAPEKASEIERIVSRESVIYDNLPQIELWRFWNVKIKLLILASCNFLFSK